jgi:hypothetical protein
MRRRSARGARGGGTTMRRPASAGLGGAPISLIPPGLAGRPGRSNSNPSSSGHNHQVRITVVFTGSSFFLTLKASLLPMPVQYVSFPSTDSLVSSFVPSPVPSAFPTS